MTRKEELLKLFQKQDDKALIERLIDEMLELETKLDEYKQVLNTTPINSNNKEKYKFYHTLYKDFLQQYNNIIKTLVRVNGSTAGEEDSPLKAYFKEKRNNVNNS